MTWVKIDDMLNQNRKVRAVSLGARWTYVASICRSGNTLSDGEILRGDLSLVDGTPKIAKELVDAGLWEPRSFGWYVHDYLTWNRSRAQIESLSRTNSENGAKRKANRLPNGSKSDSLPQNARSATSAAIPRSTDPEDSLSQKQQQNDSLSDSLSERDEAVGRLCREWERATGTTVTALLGERMATALEDITESWIADAIKETGVAGARTWNYTQKIIDRWKVDGREVVPEEDDFEARKRKFQTPLVQQLAGRREQ